MAADILTAAPVERFVSGLRPEAPCVCLAQTCVFGATVPQELELAQNWPSARARPRNRPRTAQDEYQYARKPLCGARGVKDRQSVVGHPIVPQARTARGGAFYARDASPGARAMDASMRASPGQPAGAPARRISFTGAPRTLITFSDLRDGARASGARGQPATSKPCCQVSSRAHLVLVVLMSGLFLTARSRHTPTTFPTPRTSGTETCQE